MMQVEARTLSATLTGAIAQDAKLDFDMPVSGALGAPFGSLRCRIKGLVIVSEENLAWELWLWSASARAGASYDVDSWLGRWSFVASDAVRCTGDTRYRYFIPDLDIPYRDDDSLVAPSTTSQSANNGQLHWSLIPRGAAHVIAKLLIVKVFAEPEIAWT